ncbi:uncharacterized protein LOC119666623, partial [Teleopsis dalmanni]
NALNLLRTLAEQSYRVRPFYFDNYLIFQYFTQRSEINELNVKDINNSHRISFLKTELLKHLLDRRRQILYWLFYILLAFSILFIYRHEATSTLKETRMDSFVYPGMRMWRRLTLPLIQRFPRLTEFYDESCLMSNPFFQVDDVSCRQCADVQGVIDLTEAKYNKPKSTHDNIDQSSNNVKEEITPLELVPFLFKINQTPIEVQDLYNIYASNYEIFQRDAYRVQSTNREVTNLEELFSQFNSSLHTESEIRPSSQEPLQAHHLWRCNRMMPARLLRPLFASTRLPNTGIALERYMSIDTAKASAYTLPETECANVYVQQAQGSRFIILRPTSECRHKCRTLSMRLPQSFVLSYNWWYWKPISAPDPASNTPSISLIGSYC